MLKNYKEKYSIGKMGIPVTNSKTQQLPYAHYTDNRFRNAQLVFSDGNKPQDGAYSDRLQQWDYAAWRKGVEEANKSGFKPRTAAWFEVLLSRYYGRKLSINHVFTGFNQSSGYDYHYLAWSWSEEATNT